VRGSAERLAPVAAAVDGGTILPGWRLRVLDGNHLPASEKRLASLRGHRGAALPGQTLVVYDPDSGLVTDLVASEDAHQSERASVGRCWNTAGAGANSLPADRALIRKRGVLDQHHRNEKLTIQLYQRLVRLTKNSALKRHAFQIGTFGTEVTTRPACAAAGGSGADERAIAAHDPHHAGRDPCGLAVALGKGPP